ncbi:hypothetical protein UFOVP1260_24 [uncultured Caudovirales phage]|uniref:Uncharacterized protein n=1 Tax=uncultured Caudovirales phage TaxID=2100421 RepID=A0A6J5RBI8_9CAUD|nr:hypothetical protein UFOVP1260_24 [uncultured Caudovirales phage]
MRDTTTFSVAWLAVELGVTPSSLLAEDPMMVRALIAVLQERSKRG